MITVTKIIWRRSAGEASTNTTTHFTIRVYHRRFLHRPEISGFHVDQTDQTWRDTKVNRKVLVESPEKKSVADWRIILKYIIHEQLYSLLESRQQHTFLSTQYNMCLQSVWGRAGCVCIMHRWGHVLALVFEQLVDLAFNPNASFRHFDLFKFGQLECRNQELRCWDRRLLCYNHELHEPSVISSSCYVA
jgi:hypothetical protein